MGWGALKNGDLLRKAEGQFEAFISTDLTPFPFSSPTRQNDSPSWATCLNSSKE
jgi:hypothetical protein